MNIIFRFKYIFICFITFKIFGNADISIRVLLEEIDKSKNCTYIIKSDHDIIATSPKYSRSKKSIGKNININFKNNNIYINNKIFYSNILQFSSPNNYICFNNKTYHGVIFLIKQEKKYLIINSVNLENYVLSVLKTESWPGWPVEVNKVFAIASRSYAISKFLESQNKPYHIRNTNQHQTYHGIHNCNILKQAVEETQGIILGYNNKPIVAMFDCCCGDIIPKNIQILNINFKTAPYLERKEKCNFCSSCKLYSWKTEYNKKHLENILKKEIPDLKNIKNIFVNKTDLAGLVKQIEILDSDNYKYYITGKKFYSLLKDIKSFCFSIIQKSGKIIIKGYGFGHHLGLCQWGAREMVRQGWDYKSILSFYYPNTYFMKIKNKNIEKNAKL